MMDANPGATESKPVVIDVSVVGSALWSRRGASFRFLQLVRDGRVTIVLSAPLLLEYEEALNRQAATLGLAAGDIAAALDYLAAIALHRTLHCLWRPLLRRATADLALELAVAAECAHIVARHVKDFAGAEAVGVQVLRPAQFLRQVGE